MYLLMKISSERQKGIEIVEEGFLDCRATGKELRKRQRIKDRTIGPTSQSLQHGWNIKQTRHDLSICRLGYRDTWENLQGTIPCHRTRTTEDYSRIPLVDQDESNN